MDSNSKEFYIAVGSRIRSLRHKKRYTAEELAEKAKISTKYMYQIEHGKVCFSTEILYRIARSLEATTDYLLSNHETTENIDVSSLIHGAGKEERDRIKQIIMDDILSQL